MEGKNIFENIRTTTKKSFIFIILLVILINIGFLFLFPIQDGIYSYNEHIVNNNHYGECSLGECKYSKLSNAFSCGIKFITSHYWLTESLCVTGICLFAILASIYCIYSTKCKFSVTENNIYGKKGSKKFDIAFIDIVAISQKGKGIIINAENNKLKLSPLENCDEIFNYIKPFVPERTTTQQSTSTVDDIKLF